MMDYGYKVVYPDPQFLTQAGFGEVAHLPFLFDGRPGYARLPNRFLIDLGLGYWEPSGRGQKRNPIPPSRQSMRSYSHALSNALEWAETRGIDLVESDYTSTLIGRYQEEMLSGIWSAENRPLGPVTVNIRVQVALWYQMWAADKGLREPFVIPTVTRTYVAGSHCKSKGHEIKLVHSRKGKVKENKRMLAFPTQEQIQAWLKQVYERHTVGKTEGLIAELILNTAIRREEAACWRLDTLPLDPKDWQIKNADEPEDYQSVLVTLRYGTKGKEYGIDEYGDKIGPPGTIEVPIWIARRIHEYRNTDRPLALKLLLKKGKTIEAQRRTVSQAVHLFLNPITGKRYSGDQIYRFWKLASGPAHWSPHMGRDWWACRYLEERMKQHAELIQKILKTPNINHHHPLVLALRGTAQSVIQLEIRPQLRHASSNTTEIYLQWLFSKLCAPLVMTRVWVGLGKTEE